MKIKALIPVRSGSKRVLNKNIRPFAGSTLLELKIQQLLDVPGLDGICVNSNDKAMLDMASASGVETVLRDEYYASDTIPMSEVYANMAEHCQADLILLTHVTNPLATAQDYQKIIEFFHGLSDDYDSVVTVSDVKEFLYFDGKPLNYDPTQKPRSQDLPDIVRLNHVAAILPRSLMIQKKDAVGNSPAFYKLDQIASVDIDLLLDFEIAEFLYEKKIKG